MRGAGKLDVDAAPSGADYAITVDASDTAKLAAGVYQYIARVENAAGEVVTVDRGSLVVTADVQTAAAGALQSHAERMVPLLRAEIQARVTGTGAGHTDYAINGRSITKFSLLELRGLLKGYELELAAQKNGGQLPPYRVAFSRA